MLDTVIAVIGFILALSIASERLVDIIKGFSPWLQEENPKIKEYQRRSLLQILAIFSGVLSAYLAQDAIPPEMANLHFAVLGLLASGGSGFWHAILNYVTGIKNISTGKAKALELENAAQETTPPAKQ